MKAIGKWLARVIGGALSLILVIVLLPYASRLANAVLPDLSDRAVTASVTLSQQFQESARLETVTVSEEGVLTSATDALFLGTVRQVTIQYRYEASLGLDLRKVTFRANGSTLTLFLPPMEVLADSLTPLSIDRDDFWYPLTDKQREAMLEEERTQRRQACLAEYAVSDAAWEQTCHALEATISGWLGDAAGLTLRFERQTE